MLIESVQQAKAVLDDVHEDAGSREAAVRYLAAHAIPAIITRLVQALQDDDVGVRWEAANALAQLGEPALREVLKALTDPQRVDDPRLRESAYHILHVTQAAMPVPLTELLEALRGPAADVASLVAAHRVLHALQQQAQKTLAGNPLSISGKEYGPAKLTGQLGRLNGHHVD